MLDQLMIEMVYHPIEVMIAALIGTLLYFLALDTIERKWLKDE